MTVQLHRGDVTVEPSPGGLASGLRKAHETSGGLWIGWPGDTSAFSPAQKAKVDDLLAKIRAVPLYLTASDVSRYYDGYSNGVLWPLFHYLADRVPLRTRGWDVYRRVNQRFADLVVAKYQPGDTIWVHDYQLMLLPGLLRQKLPDALIGFFLHIPFPAADIFRILHSRAAILDGLLGADLIGFHTFSYLNHFASSVLRTLGHEVMVDRLQYQGREVRLGVFPMGVDAKAISADADGIETLREVETLREQHRGRRILLGIDRLDYTKGIPRRLLAMERLFEREPALRGQVQLIQVAVPSREKVEAYAEVRRQADELVGRVNGLYSSVTSPAIQYLYRSFSARQVIALYRAADVMVVTPLRDGMNLVAKEFIAARNDEDGVLVLSEFAGASSELGEALIVNPYDLDGVAAMFLTAMRMPEDQRRMRMRALRARVFSADVHRWTHQFLEALERARATREEMLPRFMTEPQKRDVLEKIRANGDTILLLDYDGTLVPFASLPHLAAPDARLYELLAALAARPRTEVHVVSGRDRESLGEWFGRLPITLHAEHGFWSREPEDGEWRPIRQADVTWKESVIPILEEFVRRTPGSLIEDKAASVAWHYRSADVEMGLLQARELRAVLASSLRHSPLQLLRGNQVIEVRLQDVNKGVVVSRLVGSRKGPFTLVAIGDDLTDEDMFAAMPTDGISIRVGSLPSKATQRLRNLEEVRVLLESLVTPPE